ncbi:hypothetical protein MesoLjLc_21920 [Mesorhizobium sp. L-8-10]|nr:hypothetical protein MesoLjLc_21920 [Mesorhizobium sp. L-8-10]
MGPTSMVRFKAAQYPEPPVHMRTSSLDPRDKSRVDELAQCPVEDDGGGEPQIPHRFGASEHKPLADRREALQIGQQFFLSWTETALRQTWSSAGQRAGWSVTDNTIGDVGLVCCFRRHSLSIVGILSLYKRKIPI